MAKSTNDMISTMCAHLRVKPGTKVSLDKIDPDSTGKYKKEAAQAAIERNRERMSVLQELLYAEHKHGLIICLQAIDAGGKDGTISHVLGAMNPQGCRVASFRQPTSVEADHDFLWRAHRDAPARGEIVIFNRSHYEDVLIARVRKLVGKDVWLKRYDQINELEKILCQNGTHILKFFLHISKDEQLKRFKQRLDDPVKRWKISLNDYTERERWGDYQQAFEDMLSRCSTPYAPWFVIPANHKWFRNLAVSQIVVDYLEGLKIKFPPSRDDLAEIRREYHKAARSH